MKELRQQLGRGSLPSLIIEDTAEIHFNEAMIVD
jgi:hypothetical protein